MAIKVKKFKGRLLNIKTTPLCFTANTDNSTISFHCLGEWIQDYNQLMYSRDNQTWESYDGRIITLSNVGDKVYFTTPDGVQNHSWGNEHEFRFVMEGRIAASGNIMSLVNSNWKTNVTIPNEDYYFYGLFENCRSLTSAPALPATTLANWCCYCYMFPGCTSLTQAPALPATTLADRCYTNMFYNCFSLKHARFGLNVQKTISTIDDQDIFYNIKYSSHGINIKCRNGQFTTLKLEDVLCFTANEDNSSIGMRCVDYYGNIYPIFAHLEYSLNDTNRWTETNWDGSPISLPKAGDKVYIRASQANTSGLNSGGKYHNFVMTGSISASGNIQCLLTKYCSRTDVPLDCYGYLFYNCSSLTSSPTLPATTLAEYCYIRMFQGCTSLTQAPELPATTLAKGCYCIMFENCTSLTQAPVLQATTLADGCYSCMFKGCTSLTKAPELPATTLESGCYYEMFFGCTSLTQAPILPATQPEYEGYSSMFVGCSNLKISENGGVGVKIMEIPLGAKRRPDWNARMFQGTGGTFTGEPEIGKAYYSIKVKKFKGRLLNIKTTPLCFTANSNNSQISLSHAKSAIIAKLEYYINGTQSWQEWDGGVINLPKAGDKVYIRASQDNTSGLNGYQFIMRGNISASGNIQYLLTKDGSRMDVPEYCYNSLFACCSSLTSVFELKLPATTLSSHCYASMFSDCTSLKDAPELPATTLAPGCYHGMFGGCTSLINAPKLPALILANRCYCSMFYCCKSLTFAPELPATTLVDYCYGGMFEGCSSLTQAPILPATDLAECCYWTMFQSCRKLKISENGDVGTKILDLPKETVQQTAWNHKMFSITGGRFTRNPEIGKAYYCYQ